MSLGVKKKAKYWIHKSKSNAQSTFQLMWFWLRGYISICIYLIVCWIVNYILEPYLFWLKMLINISIAVTNYKSWWVVNVLWTSLLETFLFCILWYTYKQMVICEWVFTHFLELASFHPLLLLAFICTVFSFACIKTFRFPCL